MLFFYRALRMSLRYRWSILGAVFCSMGVAILWSASLSTVYPLVKVIFQDQKTIPEWVNLQLEQSNRLIAEQTAELDQRAQNGQLSQDVEIRRLRQALAAERKTQRWMVTLKPWADRYAPRSPFDTLLLVMGCLLATSAVKGVLLVWSTVLVSRVSNRTIWDMRRTYFFRALEMDQRRIDQLGTSNLMTQLAHNMQMISAGLGMFYGKMLREPLKMITCLIGAALICWKLLLISLLVIPFGAYLVHHISRRMKRASLKEIDGMSAVFQTLIETFSSLKTVRIFNREQTERARFKRSSEALYRMSQRISFYDSILRPVSEMLGIVSISMSLLAGAYLVLNNTNMLFGIQISPRPLSADSLMLFYALLAGTSDPARKMSEIVNVLVRGGTACEKLFNTFDQADDRMPFERAQKIPLHQQSLEFRQVRFGYLPNQTVLHAIDLQIPFGQALAIVGGNGCGKSTLVNLLARFYDPTSGEILLDGVPLRNLNPKKLRRQMAWVTQDSMLFHGTIRENICYGARMCSESRLQHAVELARIDEFAARMAKGLDTPVGDGGNRLSAGQRQRVALARAIVANPRILILDEATSQMDGHVEHLIHDALKQFLNQRTSIIITHRASSLKLADRVVVMDRGKIVSDSTVEAAGSNSPDFKNLFAKSA